MGSSQTFFHLYESMISCPHCRTATFSWNVAMHLQGKECVCVQVWICLCMCKCSYKCRSRATPWRRITNRENTVFASPFFLWLMAPPLHHSVSKATGLGVVGTILLTLSDYVWEKTELNDRVTCHCNKRETKGASELANLSLNLSGPPQKSIFLSRHFFANNIFIESKKDFLLKYKTARNKHVQRWRFRTIAVFLNQAISLCLLGGGRKLLFWLLFCS